MLISRKLLAVREQQEIKLFPSKGEAAKELRDTFSVPPALFHDKAYFRSLAFVTELASFHSLAQSYANKFKRINKRLINMPTHLPRAAEINSSAEQRIPDIWRFQTLQASTFLSDTVLKQLALEGQLVAFSVGSENKR